jgi:hypothetical protein
MYAFGNLSPGNMQGVVADYTSKQIFSSLARQRIKDSILKKRGASREAPLPKV